VLTTAAGAVAEIISSLECDGMQQRWNRSDPEAHHAKAARLLARCASLVAEQVSHVVAEAVSERAREEPEKRAEDVLGD
jgi:hypothetical protein